MTMQLSDFQRNALKVLASLSRGRSAHLNEVVRRMVPPIAGDNTLISMRSEVAIALELLALRGLVTVDRVHAQCAIADRGRRLIQSERETVRRLSTPPSSVAGFSGALALFAAVAGCAHIVAEREEAARARTGPTSERQTTQVVDEYRGAVFFALCSEDCAKPTPKTSAMTVALVAPPVAQTDGPGSRSPSEAMASRSNSVEAQHHAAPAAGAPLSSLTSQRYVTFFQFGDSSLEEGANQTLRTIAREAGTAGRVSIVGRTDNIGPRKVNEELAFQRARVVARELVTGGLTWSQIEMKAQPFESPSVAGVKTLVGSGVRTRPASLQAQARRTDVEITATSNALAQTE